MVEYDLTVFLRYFNLKLADFNNDVSQKKLFPSSATVEEEISKWGRFKRRITTNLQEKGETLFMKYGTEKIPLTCTQQEDLLSLFEEYNRQLQGTKNKFQVLRKTAEQEMSLETFYGFASPSGKIYSRMKNIAFIIPREKEKTIVVFVEKTEPEWTFHPAKNIPLETIVRSLISFKKRWQQEDKKTNQRKARDMLKHDVFYAPGAGPYPLTETVLPILKEKYELIVKY